MCNLGADVYYELNPLSANITKWSSTLKQFVGKFPTDCLSVLDYFVGLALIGLTAAQKCARDFYFISSN